MGNATLHCLLMSYVVLSGNGLLSVSDGEGGKQAANRPTRQENAVRQKP